jgi:hypothetical protein
MNIIRLECPSCQQTVELPEAEARRGLTCPSCFKFFTPALPPAPTPAQQQILENFQKPAAQKTRALAENIGTLAGLCLVADVLVLIASGIQSINGPATAGWIGGGALLGAAAWLFVVAQIIHIRANTEK